METFEAFINNLKHIYEIDKHVHLMEMPSYDKFIKKAGHHSIVVGTLDCGSEGLGFESHQSCGIFQPWPTPTQRWECNGPNGKAGTTQLSFIHFMDASLRVLL